MKPAGVKEPGADERIFELPGYRMLSKEQERIRRLPPEGRFLVTGGPGAGKSIVALIRARDLADRFPAYGFIVFNVILEKFCRQLLPELKSSRFHQWFYKNFKKLYKIPPPPEDSGRFKYDWDRVAEIYEKVDVPPSLAEKMLIVDEGQDLPVGFYYFLAEHCENILVTADENQQIFEDNSTVLDIRKALDLAGEKVFTLKKNWRNPYPVAVLAARFHDDPQNPPPDLPEIDEDAPRPFILEYHSFPRIIASLVNRIMNFKNELSCILTADNQGRQKYYRALSRIIKSRGLDINLTTYAAGDSAARIRFDRGGLMVINCQSCKGLEFDNVFIGDLNDFQVKPDSDRHRKLFYVMITRAKKRVYFLRNINNPHCPMLAELPGGQAILGIWSQPA